MKVLIVDFVGHPFQAELSRALSKRGHEVRHVCAGDFIGPKGALERRPGDPASLSFAFVGSARLWRSFLVGRLFVGLGFGMALRREIRAFEPHAVITSNVPPHALILSRLAHYPGQWIWWVQDLFAPGAFRVLARRSKLLARFVGGSFRLIERRLARGADAIVVISERFKAHLDPASLPKVTVVHNWAPLGELPARTKENAWSMEHGLASTFNFIYTGTLGMKHDPELLVQLAQAIRDRPGVRVIVVSEGPGADYVKRRAAEFDLGNLIVLPFQPYDRLPEVMGAADVLLALLEEDAGVFSVPSKILTYHCAARPILASMPLDNLAAQTVVSAGSGTVTPARDPDAFVRAALELLNTDPSERARVGMAARRYAEETFDLDRIADRFSGLMGVEGSGDSADVVRR